MATDPNFPVREQEIDIREYALLFWRQKGVFAVCLVLFAIGAVALSFLQKPSFTSVSKFIAKTGSNQQSLPLSNFIQMTGLSLPSKESQDPYSYLDEVVKNVEFLHQILDRKWKVGADSLTLPEIWERKPDTTRTDWEYRFLMSNVEILRGKTIRLSNDGGLRVLTITEANPGVAYQLNRFMVTLLNDYIRDNVQSRAAENRRFIENRIREVQDELTESEDALYGFRKRNLDLSSPPLALENKRLLRNLGINEEVYLQLRKEYELARIEEKKDQPLVVIVKHPELPLRKSAPRRKLFLLTGIILGFGAGLVIALGRILMARD